MSSDLAFLEPLTQPVVKVSLKTAQGQLDYEFKQGREIFSKVWPSSVRLAQRLLLHPLESGLLLQDGCTGTTETLLELGCGQHALVSRVLADCVGQGGRFEICATDTKETVAKVLKEQGQGSSRPKLLGVEYVSLNWEVDDDLDSFCRSQPKVALIVAADVLYRSEYMWSVPECTISIWGFAKVCSRILRECGTEDSQCILSYQDRNNPNVQVFMETVVPAHGLSCSLVDMSNNEKSVAADPQFTLNNSHLQFTHLLRLSISRDTAAIATKESVLFL